MGGGRRAALAPLRHMPRGAPAAAAAGCGRREGLQQEHDRAAQDGAPKREHRGLVRARAAAAAAAAAEARTCAAMTRAATRRYATTPDGTFVSDFTCLIQNFYGEECARPLHLVVDTSLADSKIAVKGFVTDPNAMVERCARSPASGDRPRTRVTGVRAGRRGAA